MKRRGRKPQTTIGDRLRELRTRRGLTQAQLAELVCIDRTSIAKWEDNTNLPVRKLKELTALFGVTSDYLMGLDESPQPEQVELPVEPAPPTKEDVMQAFAQLLDITEGYLMGKMRTKAEVTTA